MTWDHSHSCHLSPCLPIPTPHCRKSSRNVSSCLGFLVSERHLHTIIIWGSESFPIKKAEATLPVSLGIIAYCWLSCHPMSVRQGMNISSDASNCLYQEGLLSQIILMSHVTSLHVLFLMCTVKCETVWTVALGYQSFMTRHHFRLLSFLPAVLTLILMKQSRWANRLISYLYIYIFFSLWSLDVDSSIKENSLQILPYLDFPF